MAVTYVNGRGNAQEMHIVSNRGIPYTVGPANGTGKLYQPGTRGLVVSLAPGGYFYMNQSRMDSYRNTYGYSFADISGTSTLVCPGCNSDFYGLASIAKSWLDQNKCFFFPIPMTGQTFSLDTSRWGNKPVQGTYSIWNESGMRGFSTPSVTIYKWEIHVWIVQGRGSLSVDAQPTQLATELVQNVYVPYFYNNTWNYVTLDKGRSFINNPNGSTRYFSSYVYFSKELSTNLYGGTHMFAPCIATNWVSDSMTIPIDYAVCVKYSFKTD